MTRNIIQQPAIAWVVLVAFASVATAQDQFQKFTSADGRFSVEMPGKPTLSTRNPKDGTPIQIATVASFVERFQIAYFEIPDAVVRANEPQRIFKLYTAGEYSDAKLEKEKPIQFGPDRLPGLEYRVATDVKTDGGRPIPVYIRERLVLSGSRLYVVQYRAVLNENLLDSKDANRYFDSLAITKFAGGGGTIRPKPVERPAPANGSLPPWTKPQADAKHGLGEVARSAERGVLLVGYSKNHGTGWVISRKHRLVITNAHVADILLQAQEAGKKLLAIPSGTSQAYEVEKVYYHPGVRRYACAGGKATSICPSARPIRRKARSIRFAPTWRCCNCPRRVRTCRSSSPWRRPRNWHRCSRSPWRCWGFPATIRRGPDSASAAGATFHDGVVSRVTDFELQPGAPPAELQCLQYTISSWGGFSGSPIFLPNGHVVAVNHMGRYKSDPHNDAHVQVFAHGIRSDCVLELLVYHKLVDKVPFKIDASQVLVERWVQPDPRTLATRASLAKAIALVDEAKELIGEGKHPREAGQKCDEAIRQSQFFAPAFTYRAVAWNNYYVDYGDRMSGEEKLAFLKKAEKDSQTACDLEPGDVTNQMQLAKIRGNIAAVTGNKAYHKQNIAVADKVLLLENLTRIERGGAHFLRAFARAMVGEDEGALADYRAAIRLEPDRANLHEELARFMALRGIGDGGQANAAHARWLRAGANTRVLRIDEVVLGGIAAKAGLKPGYFITGVGGFRIQTVDGLLAALSYREGPIDLHYRTEPDKATETMQVTPQKGKIGITVTSVELQ